MASAAWASYVPVTATSRRRGRSRRRSRERTDDQEECQAGLLDTVRNIFDHEWIGAKGETYHMEFSDSPTLWTCIRKGLREKDRSQWGCTLRRGKRDDEKSFTMSYDVSTGRIWWGEGWWSKGHYFCESLDLIKTDGEIHWYCWFQNEVSYTNFVWKRKADKEKQDMREDLENQTREQDEQISELRPQLEEKEEDASKSTDETAAPPGPTGIRATDADSPTRTTATEVNSPGSLKTLSADSATRPSGPMDTENESKEPRRVRSSCGSVDSHGSRERNLVEGGRAEFSMYRCATALNRYAALLQSAKVCLEAGLDARALLHDAAGALQCSKCCNSERASGPKTLRLVEDFLQASAHVDKFASLHSWDASLLAALCKRCSPPEDVTVCALSQLRFMQVSHSETFRHGAHKGHTVDWLVVELVAGRILLDSDSMVLDVVHFHGKFWSLNTRHAVAIVRYANACGIAQANMAVRMRVWPLQRGLMLQDGSGADVYWKFCGSCSTRSVGTMVRSLSRARSESRSCFTRIESGAAALDLDRDTTTISEDSTDVPCPRKEAILLRRGHSVELLASRMGRCHPGYPGLLAAKHQLGSRGPMDHRVETLGARMGRCGPRHLVPAIEPEPAVEPEPGVAEVATQTVEAWLFDAGTQTVLTGSMRPLINTAARDQVACQERPARGRSLQRAGANTHTKNTSAEEVRHKTARAPQITLAGAPEAERATVVAAAAQAAFAAARQLTPGLLVPSGPLLPWQPWMLLQWPLPPLQTLPWQSTSFEAPGPDAGSAQTNVAHATDNGQANLVKWKVHALTSAACRLSGSPDPAWAQLDGDLDTLLDTAAKAMAACIRARGSSSQGESHRPPVEAVHERSDAMAARLLDTLIQPSRSSSSQIDEAVHSGELPAESETETTAARLLDALIQPSRSSSSQIDEGVHSGELPAESETETNAALQFQ